MSAYTANSVNQYTAITGGSAFSPTYDADGNMLTCALPTGDWHFFWDGENRLITASNASTMVRNVYDHQSRRIRKEVSVYDSQLTAYRLQSSASFLWDGWNPLCESVTPATGGMNPADVYSYTWGLDLSGSSQGAGGVGGLLAAYVPSAEMIGFGETCYPAYDANGNVTAYVDTTGATAGRFEYDAFGNTVTETVASGLHLPFRFSTKCFDDESGMYYYGYRFCQPNLGRWASRDPIGEEGGENMYGFVLNSPLTKADPVGLDSFVFPIETVTFKPAWDKYDQWHTGLAEPLTLTAKMSIDTDSPLCKAQGKCVALDKESVDMTGRGWAYWWANSVPHEKTHVGYFRTEGFDKLNNYVKEKETCYKTEECASCWKSVVEKEAAQFFFWHSLLKSHEMDGTEPNYNNRHAVFQQKVDEVLKTLRDAEAACVNKCGQ